MKKIVLYCVFALSAYTLKAQLKAKPDKAKSATNAAYTDDDYTQPIFPGGMAQFYKYLKKNIHYPPTAVKNRIQGKVILTFVVGKNGTVNNVKIKRGVSKDLDIEAVRVLKNSPKWVPGTQDGKPVGYAYSVPVTFELPKKSAVKKVK